MQLAIIILNYRTPELTIDCLRSLETEIKPGRDTVIVVDNASGDRSVEVISQAIQTYGWDSWVKLLPSEVNGGFSAGNNIGIQAVQADAYVLLNSDTIVRPGAIDALLEAYCRHPKAGIIGSRLEDPDTTPQISCFRYRSPIGELIDAAGTGIITRLFRQHEVPIPVVDSPIEADWLAFACVLIRREVIDQIGDMDEGYFMYFEDIDYCRTAKNAGWQVLYYPQSRVVHLRGGSSALHADLAVRKRPRAYLYASRSRYFTKFYGRFGLLLANGCWLVGRTVSLLRELVGNRKSHICACAAQDIWMNWQDPMQTPTLPGGTQSIP